MAKPILSYPGAKWRFYPYMVDYFPTDMKVFIEPFLGGGSVSLSVADDSRFTKLETMIAGDLYPEIWAFWNGVKLDPSAVEQIATQWFKQCCPHQEELARSGFKAETARKYLEGGEFADFEHNDNFCAEEVEHIKSLLALYNMAITEGENFWKWTQVVDCTQMKLEERAARMLLVNKISFSGMGDSGSLSKDQFCDFRYDKLSGVYDTSKLLQRMLIYNCSFENTMKYCKDKPNDSFIFLDPPYANQEKSGLYGKNGGTHHGFPHEQFAEITKSMPCKWFVTYDDSVIVRKLFSGMTAMNDKCYLTPFTIPGGYTMAGKTAEDALAGEELFITNYSLDSIYNEEFDI